MGNSVFIVGLLVIIGSVAFAADLELHYVNVQQGASTLVIGPDGTTVLIDAGDNGKGTSEVLPYLDSLSLDALDYTIASHLDADHIGGLDEVLARYDVRLANLYNGSTKTNDTVDEYFTAARGTTAGEPVAVLPGDTIPLGDGALLTVVAVRGEVLGHGMVPEAEDENDLSVAVLLQYGEFEYVFAGDIGGGDEDDDCTGRETSQANIETPLAQALTTWGGTPLLGVDGVDVLHVNHHGSESSTNSDWMNMLKPEVAIIPVGAGQGANWHHPRRDVVENVLLSEASCITAEPAVVLQTEEGAPLGTETSVAGFAVGDIRIRTNGRMAYTVSASGAVSQGPDERVDAGLPWLISLGNTGACQADAETLCLNDKRFEVTIDWETQDGRSDAGKAIALTEDSGYFWFFNAENVEVVVKVLDGCGVNERFWVFAAGLTDVATTLRVRDTATETVRWYENTQGSPFQPLQDTDAFATCTPLTNHETPRESRTLHNSGVTSEKGAMPCG